MRNFLLASVLLQSLCGFAQLTPEQSLNLQKKTIEVPSRFSQAMPSTYEVNLPAGFSARIFYAGGLNKPRFMAFDDNGVLHVSDQNNGKIYAMPDTNDDGVADTLIVAAEGFSGNHDVKFYNGFMYVTEPRRVWKLTDANDDGVYELKDVLIDNIGQDAPTGGHTTRSIAFDTAGQKIYVSIGSLCNACREDKRAVIEQYDIDGTNRRIFASGTRNAVGLTFHPVTNRLWANNNGSDNLGNAIPPEWIDIVRDGGFYGYPFAYGNKTWVNFNASQDYQALLPIVAADSAKVNKMIAPAAQIEAHSAPMGITFLNPSFPDNMKNGMITALRGSWNAPGDHRGYKLIYVDFTDGEDTTANFVADFCTGFITDTVSRKYWARPVGLAINNKGQIFMGSDETNKFIMQIYREPSVGMNNVNTEHFIALYPNPAKGVAYIELKSNEPVHVKVYDIKGSLIKVDAEQTGKKITLKTSALSKGIYTVKVETGTSVTAKKLVIE